MRQVPHILVPHPPLRVTVGAPQQLRGVHHPALPLRLDCGYMSRPTTARHTDKPTTPPGQHPHQLWLQQTTKKSAQPHHHTKTGLSPQKLPSSGGATERYPMEVGWDS